MRAWRTMLILQNKGFHESVSTIFLVVYSILWWICCILLSSLNCLFLKILSFVLACWVTSQAFIWLHPIKPFKHILKENKHQAPKSEKTDNSIFRIPWIPIIEPKVRRKLRKTGCQIIFTSAAKLNYRTEDNWANYKNQRNFCVNPLRKTKTEYFQKLNVKELSNNRKFSKTIKPFFSNKDLNSNKLMLKENNRLITVV